jgi:hypothetical protein
MQQNINIETNFVRSLDIAEDHLKVIARGFIDAEGARQVFRSVAKTNPSLIGCGVLIDLQDGKCSFNRRDIEPLANELKPDLWRLNSRIALVSARDRGQSEQCLLLSDCLSSRSFNVAVFHEFNHAIQWLTEKKNSP